MKKIVLRVAFIAAFAMLACYNLYTSQQEIKMSDLAMANVEALANGESYIPGGTCWGTAPGGGIKLVMVATQYVVGHTHIFTEKIKLL